MISTAVILAGGRGSRLNEETHLIPKPLVKVNDRPIIDWIIERYRQFGIERFIVLAGYKGEHLKHHFEKDFDVEVLDTGEHTTVAGRIKRLEGKINTRFHLTYGDAISSVDFSKLELLNSFHNSALTITAVQARSKYGHVFCDEYGVVSLIQEKPVMNDWINGGFMVATPKLFSYLREREDRVFEVDIMPEICDYGDMSCVKHRGFWQAVDTMKDKEELDAKNIRELLQR